MLPLFNATVFSGVREMLQSARKEREQSAIKEGIAGGCPACLVSASGISYFGEINGMEHLDSLVWPPF